MGTLPIVSRILVSMVRSTSSASARIWSEWRRGECRRYRFVDVATSSGARPPRPDLLILAPYHSRQPLAERASSAGSTRLCATIFHLCGRDEKAAAHGEGFLDNAVRNEQPGVVAQGGRQLTAAMSIKPNSPYGNINFAHPFPASRSPPRGPRASLYSH